MDLIRNIMLIVIPILLIGCNSRQFSTNLGSSNSSSMSGDMIAADANVTSIGATVMVAANAGDASTTAATGTTSYEPVLAEPPPVTLGSYPWIIVLDTKLSADGTMLTVRGLVLDEDDPPGIPTRSGYLRVSRLSSKVIYPIVVEDRLKGIITFQIPATLSLKDNKLTAVMTGPGYTNIDFPVCD